jgi:hypothetical protein
MYRTRSTIQFILVFEEIKCSGLLLDGKEFVNFVPGMHSPLVEWFQFGLNMTCSHVLYGPLLL